MSLKSSIARRALTVTAVGAALAGTLIATTSADASPRTPQTVRPHSAAGVAPATPGSHYLALGDSVTFGFREQANRPTPNYTKALSFASYARYVAQDLGLKITNASCPGETSASFIDTSKQSNGCLTSPAGGPGYRAAYPLHVKYASQTQSQLNFAVSFLKSHPRTRLVSLMIGANDGFLCQETTADHCTDPNELGAVLTTVSKNVTTILSRLRNRAGYKGQIVILNYYAINYRDPASSGQSLVLNGAIDNAAKPFNVTIADGYGAFKKAAAQALGDSCNAGLLTQLTTGGCGVHPSLAGHAVLAGAVERVVKKS